MKANQTGSGHFGLPAYILNHPYFTGGFIRVIAGKTTVQTAAAFPESRLLAKDLVRFDK